MALPFHLQLLLRQDTSALAPFFASLEDVDDREAPRWCRLACSGGRRRLTVDLDGQQVVDSTGGESCKVSDIDPGASAAIATCLTRYRKLERRLRRL